MVESAAEDLAVGPLEELGDGLGDGGDHLITILLDPTLLGVAVHLVTARLRHRLEPLVE